MSMTSKEPTWLCNHRESTYSQSGEDGVIEKILETLPQTDGWCVEFGAHNGIDMSNTRHLIENAEYSAILIEGDSKRFDVLVQNYQAFPAVTCLNGFVGFDESDGLDALLRDTEVPADFDFLSIDIDGNDYHVWAAVHKYCPKVVCIEFNPTIPTGIEYVQEKNHAISEGNSITSIDALAREKGYELVSVVGVNALYVRNEYFSLFEIADNSVETLRIDTSVVTQTFMTYDGKVHFVGNKRMIWHFLDMNDRLGQQLPILFRKNPEHYGFIRRRLYTVYRRYRMFRDWLGL